MEIAEEVATYLTNEGVATLMTDLFLNRIPDKPAKCVAVVNVSGPSSVAPIPKRLGIQILVRAENHDDGLALAWEIYHKLHLKWNILPESQGRVVASILPGTFYLDDNNLIVYSTSYVMQQVWKH